MTQTSPMNLGSKPFHWKLLWIAVLFFGAAFVLDVLIFATIATVEQIIIFSGWNILIILGHALLVGPIVAQFLILIAYSALGDGPSPTRVLYSTFCLAIFTNALMLFCMGYFQIPWTELVISVFLLPMLLFFLLQLPLWIVRAFRGWMILSPGSKASTSRRLRFSLAHTMGWSAFLSIPLTILPVFLEDLRGSLNLFSVGYLGAASCLAVLWMVYAVLGSRVRKWRANAILFIGACTFGIFAWLALGADEGEAIGLSSLSLSTCGFLWLYLRFAKRLGFRLLPFAATNEQH